jgi:hypothetical protein
METGGDFRVGAYPDEDVYIESGFPCCFYDGVIEALRVTGTVETDVATIKLVADVQKVFLEFPEVR